jgi:hypothetical protein
MVSFMIVCDSYYPLCIPNTKVTCTAQTCTIAEVEVGCKDVGAIYCEDNNEKILASELHVCTICGI